MLSVLPIFRRLHARPLGVLTGHLEGVRVTSDTPITMTKGAVNQIAVNFAPLAVASLSSEAT